MSNWHVLKSLLHTFELVKFSPQICLKSIEVKVYVLIRKIDDPIKAVIPAGKQWITGKEYLEHLSRSHS